MALALILSGAGLLVLVAWLLRTLATQASAEIRSFWWKRRKADRDDYLDGADRAARTGLFRARKPDEDSWSYAHSFKEFLYSEACEPCERAWSTPYARTQRPSSLRVRFPRSLRTPRFPSFAKCGMTSLEQYEVWAHVQTFWWAVERDGVVHQVVKLRHDGMETPVLRCDVDTRVGIVHVTEHLDGQGPLITCIRCFSLPRHS